MRIVSCGKLRLDPRQVDDWARGEGFAEANIRQECDTVWGFCLDVDSFLRIIPTDFSCPTEALGVQTPHSLVQDYSQLTFFLHGYREGDPIYFRDMPLEVPPATEVDQELECRYIPPSFASGEVLGRPFFTWVCLRCGGNTFSVDEIYAAGGAWAAMTYRINTPFTAITCSSCAWTEFYRLTNAEFRRAWTLKPLDA